ncbi:MAG: hypothetical protein WBP29_05270 [Candidatus Zixiibacteriota bacterium]
MIIKIINYLLLTVLVSSHAIAQVRGESVPAKRLGSEEKVVVPDGVKYIEASAEANEAAKKVLKRLFKPTASRNDILELFENGALICGPYLWRDIKSDEALSKLEFGKTQCHMPIVNSSGKVIKVNEAEGKLFQKAEEVEIFWRAFIKRTNFTKMTIRKLNPEELTAFWVMIPFDIEEPIFILESDEHKIRVAFTSAEKLKIMWIDDFQNLRWLSESELTSP